jgi:hypothetical protein
VQDVIAAARPGGPLSGQGAGLRRSRCVHFDVLVKPAGQRPATLK